MSNGGAAERLEAAVAEIMPGALELSHQVHANPEIAFQEHQAAAWTAELLAEHGFEVTAPVGGLDTAFVARWQGRAPGPVIAFAGEYDALPEVGHGCGHNLMCSSSAGAAIAAAHALGREFDGEIRFIGTPAEEAGNGKVHLIRAGIFEDVDVCLQIHPSDTSAAESLCLAVTEIGVTFHGTLAHASADPWLGKNALDAIVLLHTMVAQWRQHLKPGERVHGIITHGGAAPNVVPDRTSGAWYVRTPVDEDLDAMVERFGAMAEAAATASGCTVELAVDPVNRCRTMLNNPTLLDIWRRHLGTAGIIGRPDRPERRQHGHGERQPRGANDSPVPRDRAERHPGPLPRVCSSGRRRGGRPHASRRGAHPGRDGNRPDRAAQAGRSGMARPARRGERSEGEDLSDILSGQAVEPELLAEVYDVEHDEITEDLAFFREMVARHPGTVLDLGCGSGRLFPAFIAGGASRVVGIDGSPALLARAEMRIAADPTLRAAAADARLELAVGDVRTIQRPDRFAMVVVAGVISHLEGPEDATRALVAARALLEPTGVLVIDTIGPGGLPPHDLPLSVDWERDVGPRRFVRRSQLARRETPEGLRVTYATLTDVVEADGTISRLPASFRLWYPSAMALASLAVEADLEVESVFGSHDLDPLDGESERCIVVARGAASDSGER